MKFSRFDPFPALREYVEQIFVLESNGKLPEEDLKLIIPNGRVKLVIPFRNSLTARLNGKWYPSRENRIILIGVSDLPAQVDQEKDEPAGNITVEFSPLGVYRFFKIPLAEIKNSILPLADVLQYGVGELEERVAGITQIENKVKMVQQFLISLLKDEREDLIYEYCIRKLISGNGNVSVKELERTTGYTARWLNSKFNERIGTSAKNLASVLRFKYYYHLLTTTPDTAVLRNGFYSFYYDQSHFIRDFKRFTGYSPGRLLMKSNYYDDIFYRGGDFRFLQS